MPDSAADFGMPDDRRIVKSRIGWTLALVDDTAPVISTTEPKKRSFWLKAGSSWVSTFSTSTG